MKNLIRLLILLCLGTSYSVLAAENFPAVTLDAGAGLIQFDSNRDLDDDALLYLGIGYRFDNPWGIELAFRRVDTENDTTGRSAEADLLSLDALYHFPARGKLIPYLAAGIGEIDVDDSTTGGDESFLDLGAGIKYQLGSNSVIRTDLRLFRDNSSDDNQDVALTVGYQYSFGLAQTASAPSDGDNDGVPDSMDQCPDTPMNTSVDADGCTVDGDDDNDGIANSRDECPDTPAGDEVDTKGCTLDGDDDNDGVFNSLDHCPGTPRDVKVDANGCGIDSDMDGIPNHRDECPKTFPPALVDDLGCYVILEEVVRITLDVEFDFDSAESRPEHASEVRKVADFMSRYPLTEVKLEGHTDSVGAAAYNQSLSERRADTIGAMLVEQFQINASRVSTAGYGESQPIAPNDTRENRQRNRRVVAEITAIEQVKQRLD